MKKLLGIVVLGLFFAEDSHAASALCAWDYKNCSFLEKVEMKIDDLNPVNYFEKRKECKEEADRADTVYLGKERYKDCMAGDD